jgi:hypothetical protein
MNIDAAHELLTTISTRQQAALAARLQGEFFSGCIHASRAILTRFGKRRSNQEVSIPLQVYVRMSHFKHFCRQNPALECSNGNFHITALPS